MDEDADSLIAKFNVAVARLAEQGISKDKLFEQALITPSCGVGSLQIQVAEKIMRLVRQVSDKLRGE
jgi:hypothetical protein